MSKFEASMYRALGHFILQKCIFVFYMACSAPLLGVGLYFLVKNPHSDVAKWCFVLLLIVALGISWVLSRPTARFMFEDKMGFKNAIWLSLLHYRSFFEFLPFADSIKKLFRNQEYKNPYVQNPLDRQDPEN